MTILPLPLLMMNVNGKDTNEFITVWKVAAHKHSFPHPYPFVLYKYDTYIPSAAATAAKSLQSCPTLCDPIDGSPPGSPVPGILQARILEWVAISFSNA